MNAERENSGAPRNVHRIWGGCLAILVALGALSWMLGSRVTPVSAGAVSGYLRRNAFHDRELRHDLPWWSLTSRWAEWMNRRALGQGSVSGAERFSRNAFPEKFARANLPLAALPVSGEMRSRLFAPVEIYRTLAIELPVELSDELGSSSRVTADGLNYSHTTSPKNHGILLPGIPVSTPTLRFQFEDHGIFRGWYAISDAVDIDLALISDGEQEQALKINGHDATIRLRVPGKNETNEDGEKGVHTSSGTVGEDKLEKWDRALDPKAMEADDFQLRGAGEDLVVLIVGSSGLPGNVHCETSAGSNPIGVYHPTLPLLVAMAPGYSWIKVSGRSTQEKPELRYDILACSGTRDAAAKRAILQFIEQLYGDNGPANIPQQPGEMIRLLHWFATALDVRFGPADLEGVQSPELRAIVEELAKRP